MAVFNKDARAEVIYKELGKPDGKKEKLFDTMRDVYMLALVLGAINEERIELNNKSSDPIKEEIIGKENKVIMELIVLNLRKDINILDGKIENEEYIHKVVEEYANAGIYKLDEMLNGDYESLDNLITMVKEYENKDMSDVKIDLADLFSEFDET